MTFRPSDDVLDEVASGQMPSTYMNQNGEWQQDDWQHIFGNSSAWRDENVDVNPSIVDVVAEEIKAPDLSELLKNSWNDETLNENQTDILEKIIFLKMKV